MALAVCLLFDARGDRLVRELWDRLERSGIRTLQTHTHGRHRPHLSYAVLLDWDLGRVQEAMAALPSAGSFSLGVQGVVSFPRGRAALAPAVSAAVTARQERVSLALSATGAVVHRHYEPGSWVPHVSLATRASGTDLAEVVHAVADTLPLTLDVAAAALVDSSSGELWLLDGTP